MNTRLVIRLGMVLTLWGTWRLAVHAQGSADDPYQQILTRRFGTATEAMEAIAAEIQAATPEKRSAIEARLIAVVDSSAATPEGKQFACEMLCLVGSKKCVAPVGKLLTDEKLSHAARRTLQRIRDPAAGAQLVQALSATQGKSKLGIIASLGDRGEPQALKPLAALLANEDTAEVRAAFNAIGRIGGLRAAELLTAAKVPADCQDALAHASLQIADSLATAGDAARAEALHVSLLEGNGPSSVKAGALLAIAVAKQERAVPHVIKALVSSDATLQRGARSAVLEIAGPAASQAFARELPRLPVAGKVALLETLAARGEPENLSELVNRLVGDPEESVRLAATRAVAQLGNAASVGVLVDALKERGPASEAVAASLARLQGAGVVAALIKACESGDPAVRAGVFAILTERRQAEALPAIRKAAAEPDAQTRQAALRALTALGTLDDIAPLVAAVVATRDDAHRELLGRALVGIAGRAADKNACFDPLVAGLGKADDKGKVCLLGVLPTLGGQKGFRVIRTYLTAEKDVKKAAVRALADWPDNAPLADLLAVAKNDSDRTIKILALRGYIRVAGLAGKPADKLEAFKQALDMSERAEEKRLVLAGLAEVEDPAALKLVEFGLTEKPLQREAWQAYEKIGESIGRRYPDEARAALNRVITESGDKRLAEKADKALGKVKGSSKKPTGKKGN